jgi:hypothetical protein
MTNDNDNVFNELKQAVIDGDVENVERLIETCPPQVWRQQDDEVIYLAATQGNRPLVNVLLRKAAEERIDTHLQATLSGMLTDNDEEQQQTLLGAMRRNALFRSYQEIDQATATMGAYTLTDLALSLNSGGLCRFLMENHADAFKSIAPVVAIIKEAYTHVEMLVKSGVDIGFANGRLLLSAIVAGDVAAVRFMLEHGVDPNGLTGAGEETNMHALYQVVMSCDGQSAREMTDLLLAHGADIRAGGAVYLRMLVKSGFEQAVEYVDKIDAGSQLPVFAGLVEKSFFDSRMIRNHYPELSARWKESADLRDLLLPPEDGRSVAERVNHCMAKNDVNSDDGFIIKAAVCAEQAEDILAAILSSGQHVELNTAQDTPLALAAIFNKCNLLPLLVQAGADIYAHENKIFRLAALPSMGALPESLAALQPLAEDYARKQVEQWQETPDTLEKFLSSPDQLLLVAKAGILGTFAAKGTLSGMDAADFTKTDSHGAVLWQVLCAKGDYETMFHPDIWRANRSGAQALYELLPSENREASARSYAELQKVQSAYETELRLKTTPRTKFKL